MHQLDGTFACIPAWMTDEAASRFEIGVEPRFPLDVLCSLRAEVDALLGFLPSESKTEDQRMTRQSENLQPSLFEAEAPCVVLACRTKGRAGDWYGGAAARDRDGAGKAASGESGDDARSRLSILRAAPTSTSDSRRPISSRIIMRADAGNTVSSIAPVSSAGATVEVIDDDLGRSGGGIARPGFERLLAAICEGRVGAVLAIEASRLARNGRDWHTLIEFCGLVGTIIVDEDGIYDPRHPNDRLLLGMKGTMSELELSLFRQRSQEALKQKARRGALVLGVAAGYVKIGRDRIEKNPDQRVQDALQLVFAKFAELQSARQVHIWLRDEGIELPVKSRAWRGARRRLEVAGLQYRAQHPDQSDLCWCLCLRAHDEQGERRKGPQACPAWRAAAHGRMGCPDQGSARGLHHLGRVREEPAT